MSETIEPGLTICCERCGDECTASFALASVAAPTVNGVRTGPDGAIYTPNGPFYCATCAPGVAVCRVCGCTDEAGCEGGCEWVAGDLCSECERRIKSGPGNEYFTGPQWHVGNIVVCLECSGVLNHADQCWQEWRDKWWHLCLPNEEKQVIP